MTPTNDNQARTWAAIAHLSSLVWIPLAFVGLSFPILNIVGPLIVWLSKKNDSRFIDEEGKESLNFQISFTIYAFTLLLILAIGLLIYGIVIFGTNPNSSATQGGFLAALLLFGFFAGGVLFIMLIVQLILVIIAAVKAKNGQHYRYPLTIRFIR
ncbi:MAG TPA: DUF4870 domain-containing protein [Leptolyngbyaceae cyanobacterium]